VASDIPADGSPGPRVRLITVSAAYGAGGSVVAPTLAQRLGVPFLQRVTTTAGQVTDVGPCHERLVAEEAKITPVHRLLASFTHSMPVGPTQSQLSARHHDYDLRCGAEAEIHQLLAGGGVILGRAAAVVLGKDRGFHVRLDGPPARRIAQGATIEGVSQEQARAHMQAADRARTAYVRRLYRADPADASLYHMVIDSTAIPLDTVIELILAAARAQIAAPPAHRDPAPTQPSAS
jgi:cytidylate kinase